MAAGLKINAGQSSGDQVVVSYGSSRRTSAAPPKLVILSGVLTLILAASLVFSDATWDTWALAVALVITMLSVATRLGQSTGVYWLPAAIGAGFLAKLIASGARYWVLVDVYDGAGDAIRYHSEGLVAADVWRSLSIPQFGTGTDFVGPTVGLLYAPYKPTLLGGFFIFATLSFVGQLLMLLAFRRISSPHHFKWYAGAIFFLPTVAYWPASIGKEALMFLFVGPVAYGSARLLSEYRMRWMVPIGIGLVGAAAVRAHVALLLAGALVFTVAVAAAPKVKAGAAKRFLLLGMCALALVGAVSATSQRFGLDLSAGVSPDVLNDEVDPFLADVSEQTDGGGSAVEGSVITSPAQIPEATARVLFRPFPWQATSALTLAASLEGFVLLAAMAICSWRMLKSLLHIRRKPYALFSFVFTGGFIFAFSAILNLGILARQRSQVMPFLLAFLIQAGIRDRQSEAAAPLASDAPTEGLVPISRQSKLPTAGSRV